MLKVLRADLFYYKKYIGYLIAGVFIAIIINTSLLLGMREDLLLLEEEGKLEILFSLNIQMIMSILFFLFCVFGSMKQCRLLQFQIIGIDDRDIVYICKLLEIIVIGSLMYIVPVIIYISSARVLINLQINGKVLLIFMYQYGGYLRFLLWSYIFFILCNKIYYAIICTIAKSIIEVLACLLFFTESKQTSLDFFLRTVLIYMPLVSFTYNSNIFYALNPFVDVLVIGGDIFTVWVLGKVVFSKKAFR